MSLAGSRNHSTTPIALSQNDCSTGQCSERQLFNDCHSGAIHNYAIMGAELGSFNGGRWNGVIQRQLNDTHNGFGKNCTHPDVVAIA